MKLEHSLLVGVVVCTLANTGCIFIERDSNLQLAAEITGAHFQQHSDFESLHWFDEHYLRVGMPASEVMRLLGTGKSAPVSPSDLPDAIKNGSRVFRSERLDSNGNPVCWGQRLYIHFQDWQVTGWDVASE